MNHEIKLPPYPEGMCLREDIEDYARAAVEADREQRVPIPASIAPVPRYKIGYRTDEWGERSSTPGGIPDPAGAWVRYDDHAAALARAIEQAATAPMLARIAELEAELEKTKAIFAASCNHAAVMEMDRDARRYRWLRDRWGRVTDTYDGDSGRVVEIGTEPDGEGWDVDASSLDAAIDAAMKEDSHG